MLRHDDPLPRRPHRVLVAGVSGAGRTTLARRTIRRRLRREELWNGNVEAPLWTVLTDRAHVLRWAVNTRGKLRTLVPPLEEQAPHLVIVRLRSPRAVDWWADGALRATVPSPPG